MVIGVILHWSIDTRLKVCSNQIKNSHADILKYNKADMYYLNNFWA